MIGSTRQLRVYAYTGPADLRRGFDGLHALVVNDLKRDPLQGDLYVFVSKDRKRAKTLLWDGTGLCIYAKRLERGRFACLWQAEGPGPLQLTMNELQLFLEGSRLVGRVPSSPPEFVQKPLASFVQAWSTASMLVRIEEEQDIEVLRQVALQLDRENQRLIDRIQLLTREIAKLHGAEAEKAQTELEFLRELLARRERALFAESSEKRPGNQRESEPGPPAPRRGHGPRPQPALPLREEVHVLPEKERACPVCGGELQEMNDQFEEYEEITVVERQFVLTTHKRKKYRCRCNACIVTALGSPRLQAGGRYSPEFAVEVAAAKFLDHVPLEGQCRIMEREGLRVDSQTLWDQTFALYRHLVPSYEAIGSYILESDLVHVDETHWRLMNKEGSSRWYVWGIQGRDAAYYKILKSRSKESAREVLQDFTGVAVADRYSAYTAVVRDGPGKGRFALAHCWAHVRRKYFEIQNNYPAPCKEILDLIGDLYKVEHLATDFEGSREDRLRLVSGLRSQRSGPIVEQIHAWALGQTALPPERDGPGDRLHDQLVARLDALLEGCPDSPGQQSDRASAPRRGPGPEESLRLPLPTGGSGGWPVLHAL